MKLRFLSLSLVFACAPVVMAQSRPLDEINYRFLPATAVITQEKHAALLQQDGYFTGNENYLTGGNSSNIDLFPVVGANGAHSLGYTGTRSTVAIVEGGLSWIGHQALSPKMTNADLLLGIGAANSFQVHATGTASNAAGANVNGFASGVAYDAALRSATIATSFGTGGTFFTTEDSEFSAYYGSVVTGINGKRADVTNSSWGFGGSAGRTGFYMQTLGHDALIHQNRMVSVISTGNNNGQVRGYAGGLNGFAVGALAPNNYDTRSSFSNFGPTDYYDPLSGQTLTSIRARVDIAAPGEAVIAAWSTSSANSYESVSGTSFSAPIVAGGAALIIDAGKDRFASNADAISNVVVQSVLQTGATKTAGWSNGTTNVGGVLTTSQALDFRTGAGRMDVGTSLSIYTDGTTDVAGLGGGTVAAKGWDYGGAVVGQDNDYTFAQLLEGGTQFTASLVWNAKANYTYNAGTQDLSAVEYDRFSNFDLFLYNVDNANAPILVAESSAQYIAREHIYITLPQTGKYMLRVRFGSEMYDFGANDTTDFYGVSWMATPAAVPEPATFAALGLGLAAAMRRRKKA
jgi:hypothetical protein